MSLAATLVAGPILATVALAADPIVVRPGDTLTSISKRHNVPISRIVELNDLANPNRIFAGQRLRITAPAPKPAIQAPATTVPPAATTHTVRSGETLTHIARRYGVTIGAIATANKLSNPSRIYAGQRLTIPGSSSAAPAPKPATGAPATTAPPAATTHTVRSGETLTHIARRYGVTIGAIATANKLSNPSRIYAGQRLTIPGSSSAAPAPKPAASMPASMAELVARRDGVRRIIVEEAKRHGVPQALALAVAWQESGWQQGVVSRAGAVGVMQLMPATAVWVGEAMLGTTVDMRDTRQNVRAGVRLLAHYLARYDGSIDLALAAYYQGQTAADRHGVYPVSRPYIASIKVLVRIFGG